MDHQPARKDGATGKRDRLIEITLHLRAKRVGRKGNHFRGVEIWEVCSYLRLSTIWLTLLLSIVQNPSMYSRLSQDPNVRTELILGPGKQC